MPYTQTGIADLFDAHPQADEHVIASLERCQKTTDQRKTRTKAITDNAIAYLETARFQVTREIKIPSGGRADIAAISPAGKIWIIETKPTWIDYQTDRKYESYRPYCDALIIAVDIDFPTEKLPVEQDVILCGDGGAWFDCSPAYHISLQRDLNAMRRLIVSRIEWLAYQAKQRSAPRFRRA
jgi:hypothetical protein